ncbi:MAG: SGNH/GDSL hydrolase family protein, partial [Acidobacteriota bacterium]
MTTTTLPSATVGHSLAFWLLLPFAAPQGLWMRRVAPPFPPAAGPTQSRVGYGDPLHLVAIGDSIVAGVGARTQDEALPGRLASALAARLRREVRWSALGRVGARAAQVQESLLPALPAQPFDVAMVSVGVNDVVQLSSANRWRRDLGALLDGLRAASPDGLIVLAGLPPLWGFPLLPQPLRFLFGLRARHFDTIAVQESSGRRSCLYLPTRFDPRPEKF